MNWLDLFAAALATWQAVEIWHHGEIFATWRARFDAILDAGDSGFFNYVVAMLRCPFCMSVWVGLVCLMAAYIGSWVEYPVYALAVSRLANLGNDLTHKWCRTPRWADEMPMEPSSARTTTPV